MQRAVSANKPRGLAPGAGGSRTRQPRDQQGRVDCVPGARSQSADYRSHHRRKYLLALAIARLTRFGGGARGCVKNRKDGRRAGEIVKRVRLLFKKDTPQRELVDLNEVIQEMMLLLHGETIQFGVLVRTELVADPPQVMGDRVQVQQMLMNLMTNSHRCDERCGWDARAQHPVTARRRRSGVNFGQRYGHGASASTGGQDLECVLYHQDSRYGHGTADQPLHCGIARGPLVGCRQPSARRKILFHSTCKSRGTGASCVGRAHGDLLTAFTPTALWVESMNCSSDADSVRRSSAPDSANPRCVACRC
jgi:hypothetical protein